MLIYLRVIVFADCKNFENSSYRLSNPPFFRLKDRHYSEIVNQRLHKYCFPNYSTRNLKSVEKDCKNLRYHEELLNLING